MITMVDRKDQSGTFSSVSVHDHKGLREIEDDIVNMLLCLDPTKDTIDRLMSMSTCLSSVVDKTKPKVLPILVWCSKQR